LYKKLVSLCEEALRLSKLEAKEIDEIILVGGSTRIPKVVEAAKTVFGKEPSKAVNPDEAVSLGASIQGAVLGGEKSVGDIVLLDVTPLNLVKTVYASVLEDVNEHFDDYAKIFVKDYDNYNEEEAKVIAAKNMDLSKKINTFLGKQKLV
jgi:molecular chaperone DnaK (HSP70)